MRDSFKWHFQAQFLWEAYVIRHKCLHMFGHTISEMTPGHQMTSEGSTLTSQSLRAALFSPTQLGKEDANQPNRQPISHPVTQTCGSSIAEHAHILIPTPWYFPHILVFHLHVQQRFLWKNLPCISKKIEAMHKCIHA